MNEKQILYPALPMFLIFLGTFLRLAQLRFAAVSKGKMDPAYYRLFQGGEEPPEIRVVHRHFQNQFEVPPLFYVIVLIAYVTSSVNLWTVFLAWGYVGRPGTVASAGLMPVTSGTARHRAAASR